MNQYNKLVRDRIPEIITQSGHECEIVTLSDNEFPNALNEKLNEELQEYLKSGDVSELADMVEVIHAIVEANGVRLDEFEALRLAKREARGAFEKKVLLKWTK